MTNVSQPETQTKSYVFISMFALVFGYIVTKDVRLPTLAVTAMAGVVGVILFFKGLSKPEIVTYAMVVYIPFSKVLPGDFGGAAVALNFTNLLMIFIMFVWFSGRYSDGEPLWMPSALNKPIIFFLIAGGVAIVRGNYYGPEYILYAVIEYKRWITPFLFYFLVLNTVKTKEMIKNVVVIICITVTVVGLMAAYDYIAVGQVSSIEKARIGGIADQPNMLAAFFCYYMFLPLGFFLMNMHKPMYWLILIPFLICFRGIMVTFSRGGYLAFAQGLMAIVWFRNKLLFMLFIFMMFVAFMNPVLLPAGIRYRLEQTFTTDTSYIDSFESAEESLESSAASRVKVWRAGAKMIGDHPVWGVGYGLFQLMLPHYMTVDRVKDPHNQYILIGAEMGLPTLFLFLLVLAMMMWQAYKLYRRSEDGFSRAVALGMLGGMFAMLLSNMFGSRLESQEISGYLWILTALVVRLNIIADREEFGKNYGRMKKIGYNQ